MASDLPVSVLRPDFTREVALVPVVISSPTGSGKSTEVPRWCAGPVLVVEPRRVACRSLAARVAELERTPLGERVGYVVRDEHVAHEQTQVVFATPGIVLRNRALLASARTVILDEFHERSIELDLLLALLLEERNAAGLVILSATIEGDRVAKHVAGVHLKAQGRAFDVEIRHVPGPSVLPDATELPTRVAGALALAEQDPGDVLVFLPGKAEIEACANVLRGGFTVIPLHGGLALDEQHRAFERTKTRKVILATNVAETSLTIPGVGVVIDTGLVRQSRYQAGRGFLTLTPIASDSAAQRAGRAGRTAPGVCYRLWSPTAQLSATTIPEIHRESLVPLVLTAAAWGKRVEDLRLLDAAKPYALEAARAELHAWGALEGEATLSQRGRDLFVLPLEPLHARLLSEAAHEQCVDDMTDLVSVLSVGRPLFADARDVSIDADLRRTGCDVTAAILALRSSRPEDHGASSFVVREARLSRERLRRQQGLPDLPVQAAGRTVARDALIRAVMAADPRLAHVARVRGRQTFFSNGGTEIELARESAVQNAKDVEAILTLDTRAFGTGRDSRVLVTCAMAVPLSALARAGLGSDRMLAVRLERNRVWTTTERVYAGCVLHQSEEEPQAEKLHEALVTLLTRGSLFRKEVVITGERLVHSAIAAWLAKRNHPAGVPRDQPVPNLETWLRERVVQLGILSNEDLPLLSGHDFLAPELPFEARSAIEGDYPLAANVAGAPYRADYDLERNQVTLHPPKGSRAELPAAGYLPKFPGLKVLVDGPRGVTVVRARG